MAKVKCVVLTRSEYGTDKGTLSGTVEFEGAHGKMTVKIDGDRAEAMLRLVADLIVETARDTAHLIASDVVQPVAALTEDDRSA